MSEQLKTLISTALALLGSQVPGLADVIHDAGGVHGLIAAGAALTGAVRGVWHLVEHRDG